MTMRLRSSERGFWGVEAFTNTLWPRIERGGMPVDKPTQTSRAKPPSRLKAKQKRTYKRKRKRKRTYAMQTVRRTRDANGERVAGGARTRESEVRGRAAEAGVAVRGAREEYSPLSEGHTRGRRVRW